MKNINFINSLSHTQQYSLRRWWLLSLVFGVGMILVVGILHGLQLHQWYVLTAQQATLAKQVDGMRTTIDTHESLRKELKTLHQKKVKADRVKQSLPSVRACLADIVTACAASQLETCKWHKNTVEIVVGCKDAMAATQCVGQLQKIKGLATLRLVSLSPLQQQGMMLATMRT